MGLNQYQYYRPQTAPDVPVALEQPLDRAKPKRRWLKRSLLAFFILLFAAIAAAGYVGWKFFGTTTQLFGGTPLGNAVAMLEPATLKGEAGQVNVLLIGNSVDNPGHPAADLTDSIMLASLDTNTNKAVLVSIPRDLYVNIPEYGYQKINAAYRFGQIENFSEAGYPPGGTGLLQKVLQEELGIDINYHVLVNYAALRNAVNAVGGVAVDIQSPDPRGIYDPNISAVDGGPLLLSNGPQKLDGQTALNLARARGEAPPDGRIPYGLPRSDFNRSEHQRQIVLALKEKATQPDVLFNPFRLGALLDAIGTNVTTDLKINEARALAQFVAGLDDSALRPVGLGDENVNLLTGYTTRDGQSAVIPAAGLDDFSDIKAFIKTSLRD